MMRKWQYIGEVCAKHGLTELVVKARKFDDFLTKNYEERFTLDWECDYVNFPSPEDCTLQYLYDFILQEANYCTACVEHRKTCRLCEFGGKFGECPRPRSEYRLFCIFLGEKIHE